MRLASLLLLAAVAASCNYMTRRLVLDEDIVEDPLERRTVAIDVDTIPNPDDCAEIKLEVEIETLKVCTRCYRDGAPDPQPNCDDPNAQCRMHDAGGGCLVCTYGSVVVINECPTDPGTCEIRERGGVSCTECYDAQGKLVSSDCPVDCSQTMCPAIACDATQTPFVPPGECCPVCGGTGDCSTVDCEFVALPECADGQLVRSTQNCCEWYCVKTSCDGVACPDVQRECPEGSYPDNSVPPCCSACVSCPTQRSPQPLTTCDGLGWREEYDANGCFAGWVCDCRDGSTSTDGQCPPTSCGTAPCPLLECAPNYTAVTPVGECCPTHCVESATCDVPPTPCTSQLECEADQVCHAGYCATYAGNGGYVYKQGTTTTCEPVDCPSAADWYYDPYTCCPTCMVYCGGQYCEPQFCADCGGGCDPGKTSCLDVVTCYCTG